MLAFWVLGHGHRGLTPRIAAKATGYSLSWVSRRLGKRDQIITFVAQAMAQRLAQALGGVSARAEADARVRAVVRIVVPSHMEGLHRAWALLCEQGLLEAGPFRDALLHVLEPAMGDGARLCVGAIMGLLCEAGRAGASREVVAEVLAALLRSFRERAPGSVRA